MQRFDRASMPPPAYFKSPDADRARRFMRDYLQSAHEKRLQTSAPRTELPEHDSSLFDALNQLFRAKCAFCESGDRIFPYRFRPAWEALPFEATEHWHLYYAWLAEAWNNIFAICERCRPDDASFFPVQGARARLPTAKQLDRFVEEGTGLWPAYPPREESDLLDPCVEKDFAAHLHVRPQGLLVENSPRGRATISHFRLNRQDLIDRRGKTHFDNLRTLAAAMEAGPDSARFDAGALFDFRELEYGGTWYLLLRRLGGQMGLPLASITMASIRGQFDKLAAAPGVRRRMLEAWAGLEQEDAQGLGYRAAPVPAPAGKARLTKVHLANFKAIERLTVTMPAPAAATTTFTSERPAPSLLILGENAAGKSSILEAIALALSDATAREALDLKRDRLILNPAFLGAPDAARPKQAEVAVTLDQAGTARTGRLIVTRARYQDKGDPDAEAVAVFAYGAFRHYQDSRVEFSPGKYIRNLFDGSVLSRPEPWLLSLDNVRFGEVVRALREILSISVRDSSDEHEFDVIERDPRAKRCYLVAEVENARGERSRSRTPLNSVSSGFRSVLAMTCDIMQGLMDKRVYGGFETLATARGVVLIDEVEAHLHPRWKMQIMRGLRRALPNMTIIATTHDPLCLRGMGNGEVVVLQRVASADSTQDSELPELVEQLTELPSTKDLGVEQLLTSDFFQLYSTDAPEIDDQLARVGDLLARRDRGGDLEPAELATVEAFQKDVAAALPIGLSSAHRLVQDAVADYLRERRQASGERMHALRAESRRRIVEALKGI